MSNEGTTHWETCWRGHHDCALERIAALEAENERLKAPVSGAEWDNGPAIEADIAELSDDAEGSDYQYVLTREGVDALIAARSALPAKK